MSPDPIARQLAQLTGRRYGEARVALRLLENRLNLSTLDAANWLLGEWTLGRSLSDMAR